MVAPMKDNEMKRTYRITKIATGDWWEETYFGTCKAIADDIDEELHRYGLKLSDVTIREIKP